MNIPRLKLRIKLEIDKAEESLRGSRLLLASKLYDEAVSSAYYAMFHLTKAVLLSVKEEPSTHHGLITLFGLRFIKAELIEKIYSDMLIDAKEAREASNYDAARKSTGDEASEIVENADKFRQRILACLKEKGLL